MTFSRRSIHSQRSERQFQHLHFVERRDRLEVEADPLPGRACAACLRGEAFDRRELRRLDPALDHPPFTVDQFQFHQTGQEPDMVQPLGSALARQLVVFPEEGWQLQRLEVVGAQEFGGVGHGASAAIKHI